MTEPRIVPSDDRPNVGLECACGWIGVDSDIEDWDIQRDRDRVVRVCPSCGDPVPEWGCLEPISGVEQIARGSLAEALADAEILPDE